MPLSDHSHPGPGSQRPNYPVSPFSTLLHGGPWSCTLAALRPFPFHFQPPCSSVPGRFRVFGFSGCPCPVHPSSSCRFAHSLAFLFTSSHLPLVFLFPRRHHIPALLFVSDDVVPRTPSRLVFSVDDLGFFFVRDSRFQVSRARRRTSGGSAPFPMPAVS